jgi:hypothetical protein
LIATDSLLIDSNENWPILIQGVAGSVFYKLYIHDATLPILITFGSMGMIVTKGQAQAQNFSPWGFDFAVKLGLNVLSFSSYEQTKWYRCPIFHKWLEANNHLFKVFPERLGYGASMGGYAASAFSNVLNIDRLLLLNPISTLNEDAVPWEVRPFQNAALHDWKGKYFDGADTKSEGWVVYDPIYNLDRSHAKRYPRFKKIVFPGVGHQIPKHLNHLGLLKSLIKDFIYNKFASNDFYKLLRKRRQYVNYYKWLESAQNSHKTEKRLTVIEKYRRLLIQDSYYSEESSGELIDEILSIALEIENVDLDTYTVLEAFAQKVEKLGKAALVKTDVEFLKMAALKFEKEDIFISLKLMRLAALLRPNGPFIVKKVKQYESKIGSLSVNIHHAD